MKTNKMLVVIVVLLAVVAGVFYLRKDSGTIKQALSDFAVADTASIDKVFLADKSNNRVTLVKERPGRWIVNGESRAKNDMVNTLLETMKLMDVRSPVAKAAFNNVMKKMAATSVKVEIYVDGQPLKTFYVGHETQDQYGTFMYLENSSMPFVLHIPGFDGYLTTRFSAIVKDWVPNAVFNYDVEEITKLVSHNSEQPEHSFEISLKEAGVFALKPFSSDSAIENASQNKIISYLEYFDNLNYEFTAKNLPHKNLDSIRESTPFLVLHILLTSGKERVASMYRMPLRTPKEDLLDVGIVNTKSYDTDRLYVRIDDRLEMHAAQYYVFGKLFIKPVSLMEVTQP